MRDGWQNCARRFDRRVRGAFYWGWRHCRRRILATFGITVAGARGATPVSFLIAGAIALVTAYSYIGLTLRYPGPGGTVSFITRAFGSGIVAASANMLLVLSYVAIISVYAFALAAYSAPYLPEAIRPAASHAIASFALVALGLINYAGAALMEKFETLFNAGKLAVLALFIVAGLVAGGLEWGRLEPSAWAPPSAIVASGMIGFLAYEGFELIANASGESYGRSARFRSPSSAASSSPS